VFRARRWNDPPEAPQFAVKIVDATAGADPELRRLLTQEARIGAWLRHPNIVRVAGSGEHDGVIWIAMELIDGMALDEALTRLGPAPPAAAWDIIGQAAAGLRAVHEFAQHGKRIGLVHRDVKPANLLLSRSGRVRVTDFGVARATERVEENSSIKRGTPVYMSPEQCQGADLDARTDVWSLGAVAWEVLTGERLFPASNILQLVLALADADHELEQRKVLDRLPPAFRAPLGGALRQRPSDRWPSMASFLDGWEAMRPGLPPGVSVAEWTQPALPPVASS
jgi:serine/threonine-protein kinase